MHRADIFTESLFSVRKLKDFVPASHPLRPVLKMVDCRGQVFSDIPIGDVQVQ